MDYKAVLHSIQENQNELHHHGIPGMKWGRRKNKYAVKTSHPLDKLYVNDAKKDARVLSKKQHPFATTIGTRRSKRYQQKLASALVKQYRKEHIESDNLRTEFENNKLFKSEAAKFKKETGTDYYKLPKNSIHQLEAFTNIANVKTKSGDFLDDIHTDRAFKIYDKYKLRRENVMNSIKY